MRTGVRRALLFALVGATACGDDSSSLPDSGPQLSDAGPACTGREPSAEPMSNNSAVLTGPAIGTGEDPLELLRKPIEVTLTAPSPLEVGRAWAMRGVSSIQAVAIAIEVTNPTGDLFCRIVAEPYRWLGPEDQIIESRDQVYLTGSIGLDDPLDAMTCLAPGETGYLLDGNIAEVYDALRAVELELSFTTEGAAPAAALVPTAYGPWAEEEFRLDIEFVNSGTGPATFETGEAASWGMVVLLDEEGAPLDWNVLAGELAPADGVVAPSAMGSIETSLLYGGCAAALRVFLSFTP